MPTSAKLLLKLMLFAISGAVISGVLASWLGEQKHVGTDVISGIAITCSLLAFLTFVAFLISFVVSSNRR